MTHDAGFHDTGRYHVVRYGAGYAVTDKRTGKTIHWFGLSDAGQTAAHNLADVLNDSWERDGIAHDETRD